jgi:hypothetical protein
LLKTDKNINSGCFHKDTIFQTSGYPITEFPNPVSFTTGTDTATSVIAYSQSVPLYDSVFCFTVVSVKDGKEQSKETIVYPNPASGLVTINSPNEINRFELINSLGQMVISLQPIKRNIEIDLTSLPAGLYYYRILMKGGDRSFGKIIHD